MSTWERLQAERRRRYMRRSELERELSRLLTILRAMPVEKVILFGSLARGEVSMNSDLDLLVVMPSEESFLSRAVELAEILKPELGLDLLVYTPEEFRKMREESNPFLRQVLKELKERVAPLDQYYLPTRYPNTLPGGILAEAFTEHDSQRALNLAEDALRFVSERLGLQP